MLKRCSIAVMAVALFAGAAQGQSSENPGAGDERADYEQVALTWRQSAERGDAWAQNNLGDMYFNASGVPRDYSEAARWYRLAARQGDMLAQRSLGGLYAKGAGVPQDDFAAYVWWNMAAAQGLSLAREALNDLESGMNSDQIAKAQLLSRECWESRFQDCP